MSQPQNVSTPPSSAQLASQIEGRAVSNLKGYLTKERSFLSGHNNYDDFIDKCIKAEEAAESATAKAQDKKLWGDYQRATKLLVQARAGLLRVLWRHDVYLSSNVVDRLLFEFACDASVTDLIGTFFSFVLDRGLHNPGFVLYPVHSFGIQGFGFLGLLETSTPHVDLRSAGIILTPQTNSKEKTLDFIDQVRAALGITQTVPCDFQWEFNSEVLAWLTKNPLLAVRMSSVTSGYYENQLIIVVKLRIATALVLMLATMGDTDRSNPDAYNLSTTRTNNWETLDINHYIVFEIGTAVGDNTLDVRRTPMNLSRTELATLSDLNVDIDPLDWTKPERQALLHTITYGVAELERGYLSDWILGDRKSTRAKVFRKLYLSVSYFHRSFRSTQQTDESTVALAVAFETLLTDGYQRGGVKARVARRVAICVAGQADESSIKSEVGKLMERRGEVVHEGASDISVDLNAARRAYVLCFLEVVAKLPQLTPGLSQPVGHLLGDVYVPRARWARFAAYLRGVWKRAAA